MTGSEDSVWSAQDTTPAAIEAALLRLLAERHQQAGLVLPARVLTLVVVCDRDYRGEIENRLKQVGRYDPSRTIVCAIEPRRSTIDAWVQLATVKAGTLAVARERVELEIGPQHVPSLATIVAPLVIPDLACLVWAPHGHHDAEDALRPMAQVVLVDTLDDELGPALERVGDLLEDLYVVDLSWLRSTPWRERVAAAFDPPAYRDELRSIGALTVRHREDSLAPAALFAGWMSSRLNWKPGALMRRGRDLVCQASARSGDIRITLESVDDAQVPGLSGVTVESASGSSVSLDRSRGGLREVRCAADGTRREVTVMGASRGEGGILGEGVRQALLRDPTYRAALRAARQMVTA